MSNVVDARNFAKKKHAGQLRKNGKTTTFSHLKDVVKNLKKMKVTDKIPFVLHGYMIQLRIPIQILIQ